MKFECGRRHRAKQKWHRWFAWHPIAVSDNDCRWLEVVERRLVWDHWEAFYWVYRPVKNG